MKDLGLQLFSVRDTMTNEADFADTMKKIADMGYKDLHTAGCSIDEKKFIDIIKENGMRVVGTHYDYDKILEDVDGTIKLHTLWETTNIGIGGMPLFARTELEGLKKFIADFNKMAKVYADKGFKLTYHNHAFEFIRIDGNKTLMDYLYEELDSENISFVLDTCWVQVGGGDIRYWIEKLKGRLDILHLKDCMALPDDRLIYTEVGYGNLYFEGIIETARRCGVSSYVVELDHSPKGQLESAKKSADYLKQFLI